RRTVEVRVQPQRQRSLGQRFHAPPIAPRQESLLVLRYSSVSDSVQITPVTAAIGAEISGVELRDDLDDTTVARIRQALLDHLVLFFRDQELDDDAHLRFALRFGPLSIP